MWGSLQISNSGIHQGRSWYVKRSTECSARNDKSTNELMHLDIGKASLHHLTAKHESHWIQDPWLICDLRLEIWKSILEWLMVSNYACGELQPITVRLEIAKWQASWWKAHLIGLFQSEIMTTELSELHQKCRTSEYYHVSTVSCRKCNRGHYVRRTSHHST